MKKYILFDLDGTLIHMDVHGFLNGYFKGVIQKFQGLGYPGVKILDCINFGCEAMKYNSGEKTNEEVFWESFELSSGYKREEIESIMMDFYEHEFDIALNSCSGNPYAKPLMEELKEKGYKIIIATNPLFPNIATERRMKLSNIEKEDIEYFTYYSNSHFCKPNLSYYKEIIEKFELNPNELVMVGNDHMEDGVTTQLGMKFVLINEEELNQGFQHENPIFTGSLKGFYEYVKEGKLA